MNFGDCVGRTDLLARILHDLRRVDNTQPPIAIHVALTGGCVLFDSALQRHFDDSAARPQRAMGVATAIGGHYLIRDLAIAARQQDVAGTKLARREQFTHRARIVIVHAACTDVIHSALLCISSTSLAKSPYPFSVFPRALPAP